MTVSGRWIVRFVTAAAYGIVVAAAIIFSVAEVPILRALGWLTILFLIDRVLHFGHADQSFSRIPRGRVNITEYVSPSTYHFIETSFDRALVFGGDWQVHLLHELLVRKELIGALGRIDVKAEELRAKVEEYLKKPDQKKNTKATLVSEVEQLMFVVCDEAIRGGRAEVEPAYLFSALRYVKTESLKKLWLLFNIDDDDLASIVIFSHYETKHRKRFLLFRRGRARGRRKIQHQVMNRAWTARPTTFLDRLGHDLTDTARAGEGAFLVGHEKEYERLVDVLARPGDPHILLVGDPGVGKNAILNHLAYQIVTDRVPPPLFDRRLVLLEIGSLVAGASPSELEKRVKNVLEEIIVAGNIILYIPDIHNLLRTSGGQMNAADVLIPAIKSSGFSVIGATYPKEFKEYIEPNTSFVGVFEVVRLQEVTEAEAIRFLTYLSLSYEEEYGLTISFKTVKQAVTIAHKYFHEKLLPESAEDLLKEAVARAAKQGKELVTPEDITLVAEQKVNIPIHKTGEKEAEELLHLEEKIHERFIDQEEAVTAVAQALREYRSGLSRKGGPIASFLFVGPTGVGKTELAKVLAEIQFGSRELMIRFDMSEYQDAKSLSRFIGSPDGSLRGDLVEAVLAKPYSLILLDEFEKAHPDILNLFLPVLDDGRLTDNLSRVINFQNTVIIATSNAHSDIINEALSKNESMASISDYLKKKLSDVFKPELLNRFSRIIIFKDLATADLTKIAEINLRELSESLKQQGITLIFDPAVIARVAELGHDPMFGARPMRQVIDDKIRAVLAEKILKGEVSRGQDVRAVVENGQIAFRSLTT